MTRTEIINALIQKYNYKTYLEIGVYTGITLDGCIIADKIGVDPDLKYYHGNVPTFHGTSDEFFAQNTKKFDVIWIDGLHHSEQVDLDIQNSLACLSDGGTIILHDTNPPTEAHTLRHRPLHEWNGDVYKSICQLRFNPFVKYYTVNTDWGCTVLRKHTPKREGQTAAYGPDVSWQEFDANRVALLNLISVEEFRNLEGI